MMDDVEGRLREGVLELAQLAASMTGENMFDTERPIEERIFAVEMALTALTQEQARITGLLGTLTLKLTDALGISE